MAAAIYIGLHYPRNCEPRQFHEGVMKKREGAALMHLHLHMKGKYATPQASAKWLVRRSMPGRIIYCEYCASSARCLSCWRSLRCIKWRASRKSFDPTLAGCISPQSRYGVRQSTFRRGMLLQSLSFKCLLLSGEGQGWG